VDGKHNPRELRPEAAARRLWQELIDTHERVRSGGLFYLAGWLLIAAYAPVFGAHPRVATGITAAMLLLATFRLMLRRPGPQQQDLHAPGVDRLWTLVLANAALWGGISLWVLREPGFAVAHPVVLFCTVAYATALSHTYTMRVPRAVACILLVYAPALSVFAVDPEQHPLAIAMAVYGVYLAMSVRGSGEAYQRRLDLDQALRAQRDRFDLLSRIDALTGLYNRRHFSEVLDRLLQREQGDVALLMFDLDHFKRINDGHGHSVGDACLARFAAVLREVFPEPDAVLARLGGEEFAVLLPDALAADAWGRGEAVRAALEAQELQGSGLPALRVSGGVAGFDAARHGGADDLLRAVDRALYRAKGEGRDRICVAD
jgi:diguanylate cyclase